MNAQVSFIDGKFSLIHIPLSLYSNFLSAILRILIPNESSNLPHHRNGHDAAAQVSALSLHDKHNFLNISVTPIECSIICLTTLAETIFKDTISSLPRDLQSSVSISKESYIVFSVDSAGMEAGQRVMELTAPLALARVPILFVTTYYTDFILVPVKDRETVNSTLLARGFEFSATDDSYVAPTNMRNGMDSAEPYKSSHSRERPTTPSSVVELQVQVFQLLKKRGVVPFVVPGLQLVQCSGKELDPHSIRPQSGNGNSNGNGHRHSFCPHWLDKLDSRLYMALISILASQPRFLSLTLTRDDAPSLLIDKTNLPVFGSSIAGDIDGYTIPIFLDLSSLPLDSTGIVCGVAGKLVDDIGEGTTGRSEELSYLSTARAGAVILSPDAAVRALDVLMPLMREE